MRLRRKEEEKESDTEGLGIEIGDERPVGGTLLTNEFRRSEEKSPRQLAFFG